VIGWQAVIPEAMDGADGEHDDFLMEDNPLDDEAGMSPEDLTELERVSQRQQIKPK
jgi:hypothetical protein